MSSILFTLGRLVSPDPAIAGMVALAGLMPGANTYYVLRSLKDWACGSSPLGSDRLPGTSFAPISISYDPPPAVRDPQTTRLEERLLHLCKEDKRLFEPLLDYERTQHPGRRHIELLRLAIEHFEQDNR